MVEFSVVDVSDAPIAYDWHRQFASSNDAIYPRTQLDFRGLVEERCVWWAHLGEEVLGMAYAFIDRNKGEWEIGGLMVSEAARGKGLGTTLMRLALGQALINEDPYGRTPYPTIVSHVLQSNDAPRRIIEEVGFAYDHELIIPGDALPGLKSDDDGFIRGDEFHLKVPEALLQLAKWATQWAGKLLDGSPAKIDLLKGVDLAIWAEAFNEMAGQITGTSPTKVSSLRAAPPEPAADKPDS